MARILQDGFETEGKVFDTSNQTAEKYEKLDVGEFYFQLNDNSSLASNMKYRRGLCEPRGGYGQKGYKIYIDYTSSYYASCGLKYNLTNFSNNRSELFYRVWVKPELTGSNTDRTYTMMPLITITDIEIDKNVNNNSTNTNNFYNSSCSLCAYRNDSNTYIIECWLNNKLAYTYNYLCYKEWVKIDIRIKAGDANNGLFQLRINDKLITTYNGHTGTLNQNFMYLGKPISSTISYMQVSLDDVAVNDTTGNVNNSWCGNGSIIGVLPTANGSKTMFTPLEGTQNFENVDDIIPDGDATYNSSHALNDIDTFKFTIPEELGIPATESINAITLVTSAKFVEQSTDIGHIVSDGATDTLIKQHQLSNGYTTQNSIIQEKADGTKYKISDIEGLEFGYKTLETTQPQEE